MSTSPRSSSPFRGKTGYGVDEPRSIMQLVIAGSLAVVLGFIVAVEETTRDASLARLALLIGPAVGFLILAVATALYWSSRQGKVNEVHRIITDIPWGGDEIVLDLGCGRGLAMVAAGKQLSGGYAVGIDVWQKGHLSGNDPRSIWANSEKEGVGSKTLVVKAHPLFLPFADSSIDVLVSATAVHKLIKKRDRSGGFSEAVRVLRPGGRVGIIDAGNGSEYASFLRSDGMIDVSVRRLRFSSFPPFHVVLARKPFSG